MLNNRALAASAPAEKVYVEDVFSTYLYTGNGNTQAIPNGIDLSGKGGLVWLKSRSNNQSHFLVDSLRGPAKTLNTNLTAAQEDRDTLAFGNNGFTLTSNTWSNYSGYTYASWTFREARKFFDVVTYTGNGVLGRTINHNLGSAPGFIVIKELNTTRDWYCYHRSIGNNRSIHLNLTEGQSSVREIWNYTSPTSTDFTVAGNGWGVNNDGAAYVAYLFAHDAGGFGDSGSDNVISCGSYTGNGSVNGPAVTLGWEPQWILIKNITGTTDDWVIFDNMRGVATNGNDLRLRPNLNNTEDTTVDFISFTSTGFQPTTTISDVNANGSSYIYIAIRRGPMRTPTDATKVFKATAYPGNEPTPQYFSTGFTVDTNFYKYRGLNLGTSVWSRLTSGYLGLVTSSSDAQVDLSADSTSQVFITQFQRNDGFAVGSGAYNAAPVVAYSFARAPGFFDVVAYTGTGSARTINHNLGVVPELMIVKSRSTVQAWPVYSAIDYARSGNILRLNSSDGAAYNFASRFNVVPTSSVFSVGNDTETNSNGVNYTAYLFASLLGISKVGSYTGTGTTAQINCGFTNGARFVMIKRTSGAGAVGGWYVWDTARGIVAGNDPFFLLNSIDTENSATSYISPLSSGFEITSGAPAAINENGASFIFLAIA